MNKRSTRKLDVRTLVFLCALALAAGAGTTWAKPLKNEELSLEHADLASDHADLASDHADILDAIDALLVSQTVFPGDGVDGPELRYVVDDLGETLLDINTGLTWELKEVGEGDCLVALHAVDATCTWAQATGDWIAAVNTENYAGYTDWRVANIRELMSIVDYSEFNPAIHSDFGPTAAAHWWSSTPVENFQNVAWGVNFLNGVVPTSGKTFPCRVRAVRGGR